MDIMSPPDVFTQTSSVSDHRKNLTVMRWYSHNSLHSLSSLEHGLERQESLAASACLGIEPEALALVSLAQCES
eukprot:m.237429 g.237429  ORF g.237429 m.237429 type:complete len:74 (+) comp17418_c0_seq26:53-274(+)